MGRSAGFPGGCPPTVAAAVARAAALAPDVEAVVAPDGRVTFAALEAEVAGLRRALAAAGVRRGDHVGLCWGNGVGWVALFLALGSLGAVTVPVNTRFRAEELLYCLRQSRVSVLFLMARVLSTDFVGMLRGILPEIDGTLPGAALPELRRVVVLGDGVPAGAVAFAAFRDVEGAEVAPCCAADDVLLMQYTSGTTSFPRGCC